jgi:drug/metabolite transporter (DMT)-like permease
VPQTSEIKLPSAAAEGYTLKLVLALGAVYIIWGTTYYGITVGLREMPPLWMNCSRFLTAGVLMIALAKLWGQAMPTAQQWKGAAVVGTLMAFAAMTLVTLAQKLGVGSGLMATVVTTMPMWLSLWTVWGGERVAKSSWIGLGVGIGGAALLAMERDFAATPLGALCAFGAPVCWSLGSYASRKMDLPAPAMAAGAQWLVGGALGCVVAGVFEDPTPMLQASSLAWGAWIYLLIFGTMLALNAYLWLLQNTLPALAGSYSFVNPAVALAVGVWLGKEHVTGWVWLALPLMFAALALIIYGPQIKTLLTTSKT